MIKKLLFGAGLAYLYRKFMGGNSRRSEAYGQTGRRSGRW